MAWTEESRTLVFQMFDQGQPERAIVRALRQEHGADDKTIRRCLAGLALVRAKLLDGPEDPAERDRFQILGGTDHYLRDLSRAYQAFKGERLDPVQQQALLEKIRDHRANLNRVIYEDVLDLQVFPPDASQIRQWFAWPTATSWPVSQGQAHRQGSSKVSVKLNIGEQEVWNPVRQHLEGHPVLDAIDEWQLATAKDLEARLSLLDYLLKFVEADIGIPVWVSVNEGDNKADGLHNHYIDLIFYQVFRTAVNEGPALSAPVGGPLPLAREQFLTNRDGNLCHYNDLLLRGYTTEDLEKALALLLEAHTRLSDLPQALAAGRAYQAADSQTGKVRALRSEFLHSGLDLGSRCATCQPWFEALGVPGKSLMG